MIDALDKIKTRGYWHIIIRPNEYIEHMVTSLPECKNIIRENSVSYRGWDYPHYDSKMEPKAGINFVEQWTDWKWHIEYWRYFQSGQFVHYRSIWEDWKEIDSSSYEYDPPEPKKIFSIINSVYAVTEIFEFASRLAVKQLLGPSCTLHIGLHDMKERRLVMLDPGRYLSSTYESNLEYIPFEKDYDVKDLVNHNHELAMELVKWIFNRFNWDNVPLEVLRDDQKQLISGRF